jgi:hypothetical protein
LVGLTQLTQLDLRLCRRIRPRHLRPLAGLVHLTVVGRNVPLPT